MHGHNKDYGKRSAGYGWLNPYFTRTGGGEVEHQPYAVISRDVYDSMINPQTKFTEPSFIFNDFMAMRGTHGR